MAETLKKIKRDMSSTERNEKFFPATNQAHFCWQKYNEFVLCTKLTDNETKHAKSRQKALSVCPLEWVEAWDEQRSNGNFVGVQVNDPAAEEH